MTELVNRPSFESDNSPGQFMRFKLSSRMASHVLDSLTPDARHQRGRFLYATVPHLLRNVDVDAQQRVADEWGRYSGLAVAGVNLVGDRALQAGEQYGDEDVVRMRFGLSRGAYDTLHRSLQLLGQEVVPGAVVMPEISLKLRELSGHESMEMGPADKLGVFVARQKRFNELLRHTGGVSKGKEFYLKPPELR